MDCYAIALGSNRRHGHHGAPMHVIAAAIQRLGEIGRVVARSRSVATPALGPAGRGFANAAILLESDRGPGALLVELKRIERAFGRRRGRRWGARVLDLDIVLWSGGTLDAPHLVIPHAQLVRRRFVLDPLAEIARDWRVAGTPLRVRHARARLTRPVPVHRTLPCAGL